MTTVGCEITEFEVLDHSPVGMFVIQSEFNVVFWNRCMEDWSGISREDILGTNLLDRFPNLRQEKYKLRIEPIFTGGPPAIFSSQLHNYLIPIKLRDGSLQVQHTKVTSLPNPEGLQKCALFVIEDVTELTNRIHSYRKMREKALEEVEQREITLEKLEKANLKIQEQQKSVIAEERLKAILQLANATAHEMNQPLTVILASIELIRIHREHQPKLEHYVEKLEEAGNQLSDIIDKILKIQRDTVKETGGGEIINFNGITQETSR